jgi:solute carrier family 25 S-adenosylmethionine transporter 26
VAAIGAGTTLLAVTVHAVDNSTTLQTSPAATLQNATKGVPGNLTKAATPTGATEKRKLAPVNLTKVAAENRINVSLMCPPTPTSKEAGCISVDRKSFDKIITPTVPNWIPPWLRPKPRVLKNIPNSELLEAAIVAGSITEIVRTSLLYPLGTIKTRIQATEGKRRSIRRKYGIKRKKKLRIKRRLQVLGFSFKRQAQEGNLYAGIVPSILVSVPCAGVYYGVRDVTKRMLTMTLTTATKSDDIAVAIIGALVADVISLIVRTPADLLAVRLQVGSVESEGDTDDSEIVGDWFSDAIKRLPAAILTDLPYLLTRIAANGLITQGTESIGQYELIYIVTACTCAILTTPFDVARTRILIDSNDDPRDGIDGGSGEGLLRTMKTVMAESDGGIRNLYRGWFERVIYFGIGRAWLEPLNLIGYIAIRDDILLQWFD